VLGKLLAILGHICFILKTVTFAKDDNCSGFGIPQKSFKECRVLRGRFIEMADELIRPNHFVNVVNRLKKVAITPIRWPAFAGTYLEH